MLIQKNLLAISVAAVITVAGCNAYTPENMSEGSGKKSGPVNNQPAVVVSKEVKRQEIPETSAGRVEIRQIPAVEEQLHKSMDAVKSEVTMQGALHPKMKMDTYAVAPGQPAPALGDIRHARELLDRENYHHFDDNPVKLVSEHPVSTFSIDVDTGAYSNVRRMLNTGQMPREDAVRVEELVNYFNYDYPLPKHDKAFRVTTELGPAPWNPDAQLLHVGIKGQDIAKTQLPPSNLVFLVDVSGSMRSANKLELLKSSLKLLTKQMRAEDRVSLVVYAGASGVVLEPTGGMDSYKIINALDKLTAGGSTNGASGIKLAYNMAQQGYIKDGINRIILATDGDFNVGTTNFEALKDLVEHKRKSGISLTTLGFGTGNYNDHLMEQLADSGNGNYAYIDTLNEAQKVLVDEMSSTLNTIAKDIKIQIEFNPELVKEYRLIGYENRQLKREDFNNDKIDAGEIGAGHTVTALYEVVMHGRSGRMDSLRYGVTTNIAPDHNNKSGELAFFRLRYKQPDEDNSKLIEWPIYQRDHIAEISNTSDRYRFSAAVAGFGQLLRGGKYTGQFDYTDILDLARNARGQDRFGYRGEFIKLTNLAQSLDTPRQTAQLDRKNIK